MKKIILSLAMTALLTGCTNSADSESIPPESAAQTTEQAPETESTYETVTETGEPEIIHYPPTPRLFYNGEIYAEIVGSSVAEVDGELYELLEDEIIAPFINAERMKDECEYIGESKPIDVELLPERELELASYYDVPCELYRIDENQILVYCTADYEVPEERFAQTMFYPGTYRIYTIYAKSIDTNTQVKLIAKYYRYKERFPDTYRNWVKLYDLETEE